MAKNVTLRETKSKHIIIHDMCTLHLEEMINQDIMYIPEAVCYN